MAAASAVAALVAVFADAPAHWLVLEDAHRSADAVLVLAGDPDYERTHTAAGLVLRGEARLLVLTGGEPGPGDSAESLRQVALALGVPAEQLRMEQVSRSTREAMVAVRPLVEHEGIRSLVVVTSPFHQRRATWAARRALGSVRIIGHPASPSGWRPEGWWRTTRSRRIVCSEYAKLVYYGLRGWI